MATPLRYALILLLWGIMTAVYLPLVPATFSLLAPALRTTHWLALFDDPQLSQALLATVVSVSLAALGALTITLLAILFLWPGAGWARLCTRLPMLLAIPHVAFATSMLLIFAEGGMLWQWLPFLNAQPDRYGVGLGITLAVKESAFLLWILSALLSEKQLSQQVIVLDSLGYSRLQCLKWLVLPSIAPALGKAMLAVVAWSLSVVDVAIVLGPGNPPTLAVLSWQWLSQGDAEQQAKGALASLLLVLLLFIFALVGYLFWRGWRRTIPAVNGIRLRFSSTTIARPLVQLLPISGVVCTLVLALSANSSSLNSDALSNSLQLGLISSVLGLLMLFAWLEWGPQTGHRWIWLPIILPALPLVTGQYLLALYTGQDGLMTTIIWGHLLWVMPWMLFVLKPAWQRIDPRLILIAQTLGWTRGRIFWRVKCPLLLRPALVAFAVGFSVSIAQYMPTLWLGAGRYPTLTTEAVALSSGGSTAVLATQALWQFLLQLFVFVLAALFAAWLGRFRQGLR